MWSMALKKMRLKLTTKIKTRKKYTKKNPTPTERFNLLKSDYDGLNAKNATLTDILRHKESQCNNLSNLVDSQYEEIAMLRERNLTLIEAVETLARASRLEKQNKDLARFNRSRNDTVAVNECEAGYAHGYEKRR